MGIIENLAEFLTRMMEYFEKNILENKLINEIVIIFTNAIANVADPTATKRILYFLEYLINIATAKYKPLIDSFINPILISSLLALTSVTNVSTEIAMLIAGAFERNPEFAQKAIENSMAHPKFFEITSTVKEIFIKYVCRFHSVTPKIKAIIQEFNKLLNSQSTKDAFIGFELQLVQSNKKQ